MKLLGDGHFGDFVVGESKFDISLMRTTIPSRVRITYNLQYGVATLDFEVKLLKLFAFAMYKELSVS